MRVVRRFKPQVIVSIFPTTAEAGHGQHQEAGVAAHEAFAASADATRFPAEEGLPPWRAAVLYRSTLLPSDADSLTLATGTIDPASGKTYFQLAMASRSMHRSQDMGVLQDTGPRATRVDVGGRRAPRPRRRVRQRAASPPAGRGSGGNPFEAPGPGTQAATVPRGDLFAGVDTRLRAIADALDAGPERDALAASLETVSSEVAALRGELAASRLDAAVPRLREVVGLLEAAARRLAVGARSTATSARWRAIWSREKLELAREALAIGAGWVLDAYTESPALIPGEAATVRVTFYNGGVGAARVTPALRARRATDWPASARAKRARWRPARSRAGTSRFAVPAGAQPTVPYFLAAPRQGDLYDWSRSAGFGARRAVRAADPRRGVHGRGRRRARSTLEREVVHRFRDQAVGERRRPLRVVPRARGVGDAGAGAVADRRRWRAHACASRCASTSPARWRDGSRSRLRRDGRRSRRSPFALEASRDSRAFDLRLARGGARGRRRGGGGDA